jgi:ATP-binding cassette subfamily G (WHITE) protein 2 (PDR)
MTVGDTLSFAAEARAPRVTPGDITRKKWADFQRDVIMAMFGISHTVNSKVGNDFIRGISGGERKRVTIAEAALSGAPLQCWDNSTRGLDSANAIEFCKTLRQSADLIGTTAAVAIYQSPQVAYDVFDKVTVLYEGRQIYFGPCTLAKEYFVNMGFHCPDRQTVPDFLTSMTSALERVVQEGMEGKVPGTPAEFEARWKSSPERARLLEDIKAYDTAHPVGGDSLKVFRIREGSK